MEVKQILDIVDSAIFQALTGIHTVAVCKVVKVNEKTIDCQPVIAKMNGDEAVTIQSFIKVPPIFMSGGSSYTAHPISVGDDCLVIVSERCYDNWYFGGDFLAPLEFRMHDYSDGFALVGIRNNEKAIVIPGVITTVGDSYHDGDLIQDGNTTINGNLTVNGDINCTGRVTCANATIAGIDFASHVHGGVQSGGSNTAGPQ